jgi:hypothetical protein
MAQNDSQAFMWAIRAAIAAHQGDPMSVAASTACLNILTADEIARINAMGELTANGQVVCLMAVHKSKRYEEVIGNEHQSDFLG